MPRQSRIDAPGALHHIIARGAYKEFVKRGTEMCGPPHLIGGVCLGRAFSKRGLLLPDRYAAHGDFIDQGTCAPRLLDVQMGNGSHPKRQGLDSPFPRQIDSKGFTIINIM